MLKHNTPSSQSDQQSQQPAPMTSNLDVAAVAAAHNAEPATATAALRLQLGVSDRVGAVFMLSIAALTMIGPFSIDMIFPGFEQVRSEFGSDSKSIHQITSAYLFAFAVMSVFHGSLSDALGRKRVMLWALTIYSVASLGAALAPNLELLIAMRVLQGLTAGGATIISRVIIRDLFGGSKAQKLMSQVMMLFALAPAIAPIFGGLLLLVGNWRIIFVAMLAYAVIAILLIIFVIPETVPRACRQPFSLREIFRSLLTVAKSARIWRLSLALSLAAQTHFLFVSAAPEIMPRHLHLGEQDYWMLFVPIISGMILGSYLVGRLAVTVTRKRLISFGFVTSVVGALITLTINSLAPTLTAEFSLWHVIVLSGPAFLGLGSALMLGPVQLEILDMFPERRGAATSLSSFLLLLVGALLPAFVVPALGHSMVALSCGALALAVGGASIWCCHLLLERCAGK